MVLNAGSIYLDTVAATAVDLTSISGIHQVVPLLLVVSWLFSASLEHCQHHQWHFVWIPWRYSRFTIWRWTRWQMHKNQDKPLFTAMFTVEMAVHRGMNSILWPFEVALNTCPQHRGWLGSYSPGTVWAAVRERCDFTLHLYIVIYIFSPVPRLVWKFAHWVVILKN